MVEPTPISIDFKYELKDYLEAQRILHSLSLHNKVDKAVAVLVAIFGLYSVATSSYDWWILILFPLAALIWFNISPLRKRVTNVALKRNPQFHEEYNLIISQDTIRFKTASVESEVQWTLYNRIIEGQDIFLLMYGKNLYTLLPKRGFHSPEEMNAFRAFTKTIFSPLPVPPIPPAH